MDIGKLNQTALGNLYFDGWQLVEEKLVEFAADSYDKVCSHFDGADGATAYTDHIAGAFTFNGTAQLDTAQKKFGSASLLLDGDSDYVTLPDSASWDFGSGSFTTDCWIRFATLASGTIWSQADISSTGYYTGLRYEHSNQTLEFLANNSGTVRITCHCPFTPIANTWYHIALVRNGNTWYMFIDGVSQTLTLDAGSYSCTLDNFSQLFQIGRFGWWGVYFNGWIDEFRVSKGIARWTANFTPPTEAYITNSYTFSGLNGDVDEEYRLVSRLVNKYDGACGCYLRPNNDSTAANYGGQNISGISTAAAAVRSTAAEFYLGGGAAALNRISMSDIILQAKSGLVRTSIEKFAYDISTTTVTGVVLLGRSWNNVIDNITSLVLTTSQPGTIGAGTHLLLFKRTLSGAAATTGIRTGMLNVKGAINTGAMQKIYETTLASAQSSIIISGLDGNADVEYLLMVRVVNGVAAAPFYTLQFNGDTGNNYGSQILYGNNTTAGAARGVTSNIAWSVGYCAAINDLSFASINIYAKSGFVRTILSEVYGGIIGALTNYMVLTAGCWNNTADNLTSITVMSDVTNGLGIGTHLELWALRKKI